MKLSNSNLSIIRQQPQSAELNFSVFQPQVLMECQINDGTGTVGRNSRIIPYDSVTTGTYGDVETGMTLLVGTNTGLGDIGKIRIKSITSNEIVVSENSYINWADNQHLTILKYWEVWPIYPRIIPDPAHDEDVIFYKDWDIAYSNQNTVLGAFVCAGSHRAGWENDSFYYTATGTYHLVVGTTLTYQWTFEGGSPATASSETPGWVSYNTPGHYVTKLKVTGSNGSEDVTYRYVSIYNTTTHKPVTNWNTTNLSGSRGEGGFRGTVSLIDENISIEDGSVVVIWSDDWFGNSHVSLGGNADNGSKIFFAGHILDGTISISSNSSSINFDIGTISEVMRLTETYAISLESEFTPTKWFQMKDMDGRRGIYHYLKWHSTVLFLADFQWVGTDQLVKYFDTDRQSLFDAIDNYLRNALIGALVCDRQGKLWAEVGAMTYTNPPASFPTVMDIARSDWIGTPSITENLSNTVSFIEVGGVSFSGGVSGTSNAFLSQAPGDTPYGRGTPDNIPGLAISGQSQLNQVSGNVYTNRNAHHAQIDMGMSCSFRNLDIAPQETVGINIPDSDTDLGVEIVGQYIVDAMSWSYDATNHILLPEITLLVLVTGDAGVTIVIPDLPDDGGGDTPHTHPFPFPSFTGSFGGASSPTYTWVIRVPVVGGVPGPRLNMNHLVSSIDAYCVGGASVTFNLEYRNIIGTVGTDIVNYDMDATPSGITLSSGSVSNPSLMMGDWLWLDISGIVGAVSQFVVTLGVT